MCGFFVLPGRRPGSSVGGVGDGEVLAAAAQRGGVDYLQKNMEHFCKADEIKFAFIMCHKILSREIENTVG